MSVPIVEEGLSDAAIAAELARRRGRLARIADGDVQATVPALAWRLGGDRFATPLADLYAVSGPVRVTAVPGAPAALIGVFGRRGVIHSLFDPAAALGMAAADAGGAVLLLRQERPRIAIRVDGADGVIDLPAGTIGGGGLARLVVLADGATVSIVDTGALIGHLTGQTVSVPSEG